MAKDRVRNKKRKAEEDPPKPEQQQQSEDEYEDPQQKRFIKLKKGWALMEEGIAKLKKILQGSPEPFNSTEYMQLYTTIYNMCTQKPPHDYSEQLYKKYKEALVSYINTAVVPSLTAKHGEFLLREMVLRWRNHIVMVKWLSRFFSYIDRYYVTRRALQPLQPVGLVCFRDNVYDKIKSQVTKNFISIVEKEREGDQIDRGLMKNLVDVVVAMNTQERDLYVEFEEEFLNDSEGYYSRQASSWIAEETCPDYMFKAEECLKKEKERVENYLQPGTEDKLLGIVQNELLVVYTSQLIEKEGSGCEALLRDNKDEDLSRMYRLFNKIPKGLESVANIFKHHVTAEGNALIKQAEQGGTSQEKAFVKKVIDLHDTYTRYTTDCFASNLLFYKAIKEAFEAFCNKNVAGSTSGELLASFLDDILKSDKLSDEEVEEAVDKVVKLLDYVSEKDIFAEFHRKKLARRLLFDKSANDGHERATLIKLKKQLGGHCTSKMEGMITDLVLGRENQSEFSEYLGWNEEANPGIDLSITVLTTGCWPTYKSSEMNLPEEMAKSVQVFKEFYQLKTKSRKLTWIYSLGSCQVNGKFEQKTIEIGVGAYQAAALLLFNHSDKLSYSEIKTQLNLADEHLNRALHSLSCGKYKILIKEPNSKIVTAKDTFTFNSKFTDRMRRIKVPLPPAVDERKKVVEDVDKERRYAIDACIVRIMKSRKVLGHQLLVTECVEQLSKSFKPDFKVIKRRIEHLISQEYLERDNENPNLFRYLA